MATFVYNLAAKEVADQTLALLTDTIKGMLVTASYVPDRDDDVVDAGGANDPVDHEINVTNYARGWGGAGRLTLAGKTIGEDDPNDRAEFDADDLTWTALGNGSNETVAGLILIKEGGANDTTSRLIAYLDIADTLTNGNDFKLIFDAEGIIQFSTV